LDAEDVKGDHAKPSARDDDTHYFQSYAENGTLLVPYHFRYLQRNHTDIHAVMINDKVRTATYANFILNSPNLFRDAIVLDVGCGTGILSLFAARAGAKRVIAVDASDVVEKAAQNVKANGFDNIITVVRGKVESVVLPDDIQQVDIIISEWMGYALLYESMLDSVLHARDRFLRPGGVMAPSQCKMMLGLCDASEIYKERIGFWDDVYGELPPALFPTHHNHLPRHERL
jgi:type I protein arginine methyltransferase